MELRRQEAVLRQQQRVQRPQNEETVDIIAVYKSKAKKVCPVDANDGTGSALGGKSDWYERLKERDVVQEQIGRFKEYLLPCFTKVPRGTQLTRERLDKMDIGVWLWEDERKMVEEMLVNREGALAFDWIECGKIYENVCPPVIIKTVSHDAWQEPKFYLPRTLIFIVIEMLRDCIKCGILEKCDGPYRNPWFLVTKKVVNTYRLINTAMKLNSVTLYDANLPLNVDEFSEEFVKCAVASLIDFFSRYDQLTLDPKCRDMTAFDTPLRLLRITTPPQGTTNSVTQFVKVIMTILEDIFPHIAMLFLDDIGVKGLYTKYDNEEILPRVRRFVFEHIQMLDTTLERLKRAEACIGAKSQFCHNEINIVGFIYGYNKRSPANAKIVKIIKWPPC